MNREAIQTSFRSLESKLKWLAGFWMLFFVTFAIAEQIYRSKNVWDMIRVLAVRIMPNFWSISFLMQYSFVLLAMKTQFQVINETLARGSSDFVIVLPRIHMSDGEIKSAMDLHYKLHCLLKKMTKDVSFILLNIILGAFTVLAAYCFLVYRMFEIEKPTERANFIKGYCTWWILVHGIKLLNIFHINQMVQDEVNYCEDILHVSICYSFSIFQRDETWAVVYLLQQRGGHNSELVYKSNINVYILS
jgi:hypothetical protein